ncbi:MAG: hypothetical protein ACLRNQ_10295 [Flavonifractor plautii]
MRDGYVRRIAENALGALVSAVGIAMMLQANVGLEPWKRPSGGHVQHHGHHLWHGLHPCGGGYHCGLSALRGAHRPGHGAQHRAVRGIYRRHPGHGVDPPDGHAVGAYSCWRPGWRSWSSAPGSICAPPWVPAPGTR